MKYLRLVILALALLIPQSVCAQHADRTFHHFRMRLMTGEHIEGTNGVLTDTTFQGRSKKGDPVDIPRGDIRALDISKGSQAGKGAAIGAAMGLFTGLLAIAQVSADKTKVLNKDAAAKLTIGLTIGGGLIGAAIGSGHRRWESVPVRTALWIAPGVKGVMLGARVSF
jgi:hypothetical protein